MRTSLRQITVSAGLALVIGFVGIGLPTAVSGPAAERITSDAGASGAGSGGGTATADDASGLPVDIDALLAADRTPKADGAGTRGAIRRLAAWRRLVHATIVIDAPKLGGLTTIQLDHGTISAVSSSSLTIAESRGGSVTVALGEATRVRRGGTRASVADLTSADEVFVISTLAPGGVKASLVVVPRR
jgi:hypothetical protein